jgi:hypothetical protein
MQIVVLLAELNGVEMQAADIDNACLEAVTKSCASLPVQSLRSELVTLWLSARLCMD